VVEKYILYIKREFEIVLFKLGFLICFEIIVKLQFIFLSASSLSNYDYILLFLLSVPTYDKFYHIFA